MSRFAYVTLVTNAEYALGAKALINSLKMTGTQADIAVLHTGGVADSDLAMLRATGATLVEGSLLETSDEFNQRHQRDRLHANAPFTRGNKPAFHTPLDNFVKLRLWEMQHYETCVFLDADTVVMRNIDRLFAYPQFSAAPNVYESLADFHRMNSGVFVAKPSAVTFRAMMAALDTTGAFWPRTDQTFLQHFFPQWHGLPVFDNMLQYVWFNMPELWDWASVNVVHFQYEKPWQDEHPKAEKLQPLIDIWRSFEQGRAPDPATLRNPG
ncbi:glycosyltransferase [Limoniibacter endophyticus]|uniref:Glycosyl transferase n=1 Tax=Limoniibacter endophyticus TaxID=1565040 RepID=A0A8J3DKW7_9HYPH|nr:glycosyltransferase [Limoniibacter endophyticus]GHC65807.1 glycosyl transferase [Limoniibacter endophyticus]